ncbi:TonB-dependent receptor [uncultured Polaribacter sp.]|uniref:SusC/RagA family TonB-linked outer membrane protein n=1 Tax=uncultured Polaribacter sp. TaxID=174711 RepID=UPI00260A2ED7|nr:TonB-dependent receptor [uncultured Polaribacter sp.]
MKLKLKITLLLIMLVNISFYAQDTFTLKGSVKSKDGSALPGVTIQVLKTAKGVQTDFDGNYSLKVKKGDVLQFSYLGFAAQTVIINNQKILNISLIEDASLLDEIVVVGYGTQRKSHLTGAISKVVNENLDQIAVARVDDALIGQVSGVNISATNAEAGGAPTIRIRGTGSISSESGPAIVVDGIIVDSDFLGNLDMNNVASFEILKDAASAAIYGSEGSNGVILITTKTGKAGDTKFSYNTYTGYKQAFKSEDYSRSLSDWAAVELAAEGELSNGTLYAQKLIEVTGIDRDWQDVFFNGGFITSHSLSARGGTENTKFSTSLRYLHDEGVVITDDYKLYSANLKVDSKIGKKLKFGISATPSYSKKRSLPTSIHNPIRQSPWLPIYHTAGTLQFIDRDAYPNVVVGDYFREDHLDEIDINGDGSSTTPRTSGDQNPYAQYVEREHFEFKTKLLTSTYLSYKVLDGLTAKTSLGVTLEHGKRTRWDGTEHHHSNGAAYELRNRFRSRLISDNTLSYNKVIGNHEFNLLAGATIQQRTQESSTVNGSGYSNDLLKNLQGATIITKPVADGEQNWIIRKIGYFARVNYVYDNKYLFNASIRRDGSSVFGVDTKWGNFPAISVGWNVHNENFLEDSFINLLKFRGSYGLTGNENFSTGDDLTNTVPYLALLQSASAIVDDGAVAAGFAPLNIANAGLGWESSKEFNPGVDFGFLNNRISGSIDYYNRTSDALLLNQDVSYVTGFSGGIVNIGEVRNSGFEYELRTKNVSNENFSWNTTVIASTNKNELLDFGNDNGNLTVDGFDRNTQWINLVGNPISSFYGYVADKEITTEYWDTPYNRINGQAQDIIVKDLNGDGLITDDDKTILGDPYPDIIWSLTNDFKIHNFDFSFMIQGSQGGQIRNVGDQYFYHFSGATLDGAPEQLVANGTIPDVSFLQQKIFTSDIVQNAGYFSLRNVNIGYKLPADVTSKLGLSSLRIYATGQNLIYITSDDYHGFNPEYIDNNNTAISYGSQRAGTPLFSTYSVGLNLNF